MRPKSIEEIVGQGHIVGKDKLLYRMIKANRLTSIILYGPPGTGKTTIAHVIAEMINLPFHHINAVTAGKKEMESVVGQAKLEGQSILFVDEVHRFNKGQQDYLLPYIENGLIILIGATTENPYFEINHAIQSRCTILELTHPMPSEIIVVLERALHDQVRGLGLYEVKIEEAGLAFLAESCNGDIRTALNALEVAVLSTEPNGQGVREISLEALGECLHKKSVHYDKKGDQFYNVISAFQKSIRGSDVHAALHYLGRLVEVGDLKVICRRLLVTAYEDIGLANSTICANVLAAIQSAERLGLPEARIPLAVAVTELCLSPKSNSAYKALDRAIMDIRSKNIGDIPAHLKDAHYPGASELGRGQEYLYPHHHGGWVYQQYLPNELVGKKYYKPKEVGNEKKLAQLFNRIEELIKLRKKDESSKEK